jgi:anti-sigma B factor antagonist
VSGSKSSHLAIDGELTIYRAAELKTTLLAALDALGEDGSLEIDLSKVSELDTAGVQLLLVAKQTARMQNKQLTLVKHSSAVLEVFKLVNLAWLFGETLPERSGSEAAR